MATTISCSTAGIAIGTNRATINNYLFIECEPVGIAMGANESKIRAGVRSGAVIVDSWDPDHGDFNVENNHSVKVNLHAYPSTIVCGTAVGFCIVGNIYTVVFECVVAAVCTYCDVC